MLTILVEYLAAARKTGPRGAGAGLGGQPPCVTGGSGRRGRRAGVRAWRPVCSAAGWRGRTRARWPGGLAALLGQRRLLGHWRTRDAAGVLFGPATPRIRARHCRVKIGDAAGPAPSAISYFGRRHVSPLPRHHAWRGTGIWPRAGNRRGQKC